MPLRLWRQGESSDTLPGQLPFTNETISDSEFENDNSDEEETPTRTAHTRPNRASSSASTTILSSSVSQRTPARSFAHHAQHATNDTPQYSSHGVRERTQELASYALDPHSPYESRPRRRTDTDTISSRRRRSLIQEYDDTLGRASMDPIGTDPIEEASDEASSPDTVVPGSGEEASQSYFGCSITQRDHNQSYRPAGLRKDYGTQVRSGIPEVRLQDTEVQENTEGTPLLPKARLSRTDHSHRNGISSSDKVTTFNPRRRLKRTLTAGKDHVTGFGHAVLNRKNYSKDAAIKNLLSSAQVVSAVFLGLLLNVLDALSYGYILFPLGVPMFSHTGPDGISIFFVSCIVAQLCYSLGLSMFKGGVGSEMIEVVPFFHNMAYAIMDRMEGKSEESIMATVIVSYCMSSVVTGLIFLSLGLFKLGNLVSFFPRHILIGCIGGVGFFLFVTGIEVSARLEGNLNYDLETLHKLFERDTVSLWLLPLTLAVIILVLRRFYKSPFILPAFFIGVFAVFYIVVKGILKLDLENVRNAGWIFEQPESGVPFYRFYSYFKFGSVDVGALFRTLPTMIALSFFGIIHVPINVPALGAAVKEDHINVNRELIAHGVSNTLSGLVGSIQNYLVYSNSIMFIDNGGDSRVAGVFLAFATGAVWVAGPAMIGFIPVCLVGALIFLLGIELLEEAVWDTFGKLHRLEYLTIIAIVLIMGVYDFVVGIFSGIVLACLSYVVQSSRTPAIRASYTGEIVESTVRRPRADRRYLSKVRGQIRVIKLSGYLFFGTIVAVEEYMRSFIEDENFKKQPISFMIVDFTYVTDIDFSGSEGFQRINRILSGKGVNLILSGVSFTSKPGQALQNVGLLDTERAESHCPPPRVFEDLNTALEACENELLEAFYSHRTVAKRKPTPPMTINTEAASNHLTANLSGSTTNSSAIGSQATPSNPLDPAFHSPRRGAQMLAAATTMREHGDSDLTSSDDPSSSMVPSKWKHFAQPIKIMLQTFEDVSAAGVDFWSLAAPYFERREYPTGTVLYSRGDEPDGFYILEKGRFRAEYQLDQGSYYEVILPGTTCGELPFFSETDRTGTVAAEGDSVAWLLTRERFREMERVRGDVARELLKVGLKLTKERMDAITSYVLVTAS
ncbi:hypothetical protein GQ43DRAFT_483091 [Delitschia confertaspora ATCC 74209]|uniref:Sulfate permease n=1 Tax=Delitschia confertaspora ATCC 74209 TaxID=1513339 RepID=A0A9P4MQ87_9PLEO|nr:hypothetical protein GQ43DRAFT_483091 [Delitschia confertaspora ATCC 74209]